MCTINIKNTHLLFPSLSPLCLLVLSSFILAMFCPCLRLSEQRKKGWEEEGGGRKALISQLFWFVSREISFLHRQLVWRQTLETTHTHSLTPRPSKPHPHHFSPSSHPLRFTVSSLCRCSTHFCHYCFVPISQCFDLPEKFFPRLLNIRRTERRKRTGMCLPHILAEWESVFGACVCVSSR